MILLFSIIIYFASAAAIAVFGKGRPVLLGALVLIPYVAIPVALFSKIWTSVDDHDDYGGGCANLQREKAGGHYAHQPCPGPAVAGPVTELT
mgnify:CR=1 FL=1